MPLRMNYAWRLCVRVCVCVWTWGFRLASLCVPFTQSTNRMEYTYIVRPAAILLYPHIPSMRALIRPAKRSLCWRIRLATAVMSLQLLLLLYVLLAELMGPVYTSSRGPMFCLILSRRMPFCHRTTSREIVGKSRPAGHQKAALVY